SPGRMSAVTAICFVMTTIGLLAGVGAGQGRMSPLVPLTAAALLMVMPALATLAYVARLLGAEIFTRLQGMAIHTAAAFLLIGVLLTTIARGMARNQRFMTSA